MRERINKTKMNRRFAIQYPIFILLILLFFNTMFSARVSGQKVDPLGKGVPNLVLAHCFYKGSLYAVFPRTLKTATTTYVLTKWDGVSWANLDSFISGPVFNMYGLHKAVCAMTFYNEDLYIAGGFDSVVNLSGSRHIIKWSANKWVGIGGSRTSLKDTENITSITSLVVYQNQLYAAGSIDTFAGIHVSNIASWNGTKWSQVGSPSNEGVVGNTYGFYDVVNSMFIYQDSLYVLGAFNKCGGLPALNVARWDGTNWNGNYIAKMFAYGVFSGGFYNGELYVCGINNGPNLLGQIYKTKGTSEKWINVTPPKDFFAYVSFGTLNGKLWVTGYIYHDTLLYNTAFYDGIKWGAVAANGYISQDSGTTVLDTSGGSLYMLGWYFGDTASGGSINAGTINTELAKITGHIYNDINSNCKFDNTDLAAKGRLIRAFPGPYYAGIDSTGYYEMYIPGGKYSINFYPTKHWEQVCPVAPTYYTIDALNNKTYTGNDFATIINPNIKDLKISIIGITGGYYARKGFKQFYRIAYLNNGTMDIASGSLYLHHPTGFANFSASPAPDSYSTPLARWNFANLKVGEERDIDFGIYLDTSLKLGDTIGFYTGFDVTTNKNDSDLHDNFDTLIQMIASPHDPNEKQSYPSGNISSTTTGIKYLIRFQNTGDTSAIKVVVVDTLDLALPLTDVIMNSASHPYTLQIINNVLIWTFNNVNLPDKNKDPAGSNGYISFSTGIKQGVGTGTVIHNTAYIYFDYEQPVITNKTANKITYKSTGINQEYYIEGHLKVFPNPASQQLFIENTNDAEMLVTIFNERGQIMKSANLPGSRSTPIDVGNFSNGVYFIRAENYKATPVIISH